MTDETKNGGAGGHNGARKPVIRLVKGTAGKGGQNAPISDLEELQGIAGAEASPLVPYYENRPGGLFFIGVDMTREGEPYHLPALHIADPIGLIGRGTGEDGKEYRIIEYARRGERQRQQAALPLEGVGMPDCWRFLRGLGIGIKSGGKAQGALADYLQWEGDLTDWQIANRGGWLNEDYTAYVLPSGEIIGHSEGKVIYNGDTSKKTAYTVSGTLESW